MMDDIVVSKRLKKREHTENEREGADATCPTSVQHADCHSMWSAGGRPNVQWRKQWGSSFQLDPSAEQGFLSPALQRMYPSPVYKTKLSCSRLFNKGPW